MVSSLQGVSGQFYGVTLYPIDNPPSCPGVYAAIRWTPGQMTVVYVGEARDVQDRLANHERRRCFVDREGANWIAVHIEFSDQARAAMERDVIGLYDPPCNRETVDLLNALLGSYGIRK